MADAKVPVKRPSNSDATDDPEFRGRLAAAMGADYRIDKLIGEGGFGRVYSGMDVRLERPVAIKVIRPDLAGARAFLDRFRKEAMAMAKFRHPGIVPIYDIKEGDGLIYFVMPLIAGDTLRARLEKHRVIAPQETRKLLVELCDCLVASHRAGIIHRDIKPDNVMLEAGALSRALLMDFGIAKSMADLDGTVSGTTLGTPTYMSPEQANGDSFIDHRSDIYSVGALGYHMLTGRPPFVGTPREIIAAHFMKDPDSIRKLNPSVPKPLADAIMRCLAKQPADRFQDAMDLSAELQRVSFGDLQGYVEAPRNFAWPFFAGCAVMALVAAALGQEIRGFDTGTLWWIAGGFALIAVFCSPVARATTEPGSRQLQDWIRHRLRRPQ
jgi:serine/threonine protein kinase